MKSLFIAFLWILFLFTTGTLIGILINEGAFGAEPTYQLIWHPVPRATNYVLEKQNTLNPEIWTNDTLCSESYACSIRTYRPVSGVVEQWKVKAVNVAGSAPSLHTWTVLTLDWSAGNLNYSTQEGNGAMGCTLVKVMLPSENWTVTYSYQGAIPVWVKATCDFDYTKDNKVNLSDFIIFGPIYAAAGKPLNMFANFGSCY
jgi:hypothetical protein